MKRKYKRLRFEDRKALEIMLTSGFSISEIAELLGVHRDTIYRELHRSGKTRDSYTAEDGQKSL